MHDTSPDPILNYRGKPTSRPLIEFQLISQPPRKDLFLLIRIAFFLLTFMLITGGNICFRLLGRTWFAGTTADGFALMQLHPNYAERLDGFLLHARPPEFVHAVLAQPDWPYARWYFPPTWLLVTLWTIALLLTWQLTRIKKPKSNPEHVISNSSQPHRPAPRPT
jgi:hypothetical protein